MAKRTNKPSSLAFRQIHLDFHTGPAIPDVGVDFDAREFARTMKRAHVNSVTVFAKCHHGHLYYDTARAERHPGLVKKLHLLEQQVEALHREGIRAPIYISIMCDEYAADTHPEWVCRQADGKPVGAGPLDAGWQILDMSSPYQEFLAEQTREILRTFKPVDGVFFDMTWDQISVSHFAVEEMLRNGLDPANEADRYTHAHQTSLRSMKRFRDMVLATSANASVFFNGRAVSNLREEVPFQTQSEIESLPTGGWGYMYFPKNVRFARNFPLPYMGMTARFHKSWADFGGIKPYAALEYETSQMIAHGARCSVGDQLHPRGTLDPAAYDLIGRIYERIEAREPWLTDAKPQVQIAILQSEERPTGMGGRIKIAGQEEGAVRMLNQLKHQFDLIDRPTDFAKYELLILPDNVDVDAALAKKINAYLKGGGKLLASFVSGLNADGTQVVLPALGVKPEGMSPFTTTYIRFGEEIAIDVPKTDHVMYETGVRVVPLRGMGVSPMRSGKHGRDAHATKVATSETRAVARVVEPYFERSWMHFSSHFQTPPDKVTKFAAATLNADNSVGYVSYPIFSAFARHGNAPFRLLVRNLLERLLPDPLLRVDAPTSTESTVMRQRNRTIVHLLQYCPERRTEKLDLIEDIVPLYAVPLSLKLAKSPKRAYLAPDEMDLPFEYLAGRVNLRVPEVRGHAMVVFE